MVDLDLVDDQTKEKILETWNDMSQNDKNHFINQVALALSVWGSDEGGKILVVEVLRMMAEQQTNTLADFGLFIEKLAYRKKSNPLIDKIERAAIILEGYRIKNALPSEPHIDLGI